MEFKCGIIGLPNVGKSTLFNALTQANVEAANFPFCTIKPNIGVALVNDPRLQELAKIANSQHILPTIIKFVDVPGLIEGASKGEGMGNQFLSHIQEIEVICHVVRCFTNKNIIHVTKEINPIKDINIINTELLLADLNICERAIKKISKKTRNNNDIVKNEIKVLEKCLIHLENAKMLRVLDINQKEKELISSLGFLTLKPTMYIANVDEDNFQNNSYLNQIKSIAEIDGSIVVPVCAIVEATISNLKSNKGNNASTSWIKERHGLNRIICAGYSMLNLQTYFTVGIKEIRAWTIRTGTTALQAASKIHTDFKKGFIRAQIISYNDFIYYKGELGAKKVGKLRTEGKNYIVKDGDIINFLFNI